MKFIGEAEEELARIYDRELARQEIVGRAIDTLIIEAFSKEPLEGHV